MHKHGFSPGSENNARSHNGDREEASNVKQGGFAKSLIKAMIVMVMVMVMLMVMVTVITPHTCPFFTLTHFEA